MSTSTKGTETRHELDTVDHRDEHLGNQDLYDIMRIDQVALDTRNKLGRTLGEDDVRRILSSRVNTMLKDRIQQNAKAIFARQRNLNSTLSRIWDAIARRSSNDANNMMADIDWEDDIEMKIAQIPTIQLTNMRDTSGSSNLPPFSDPFWANNTLEDIFYFLQTGRNPPPKPALFKAFVPPPPNIYPPLSDMSDAEFNAMWQEISNHPSFQVFLDLRRMHSQALIDMYKHEVAYDAKRMNKDFFQPNFSNEITALGLRSFTAIIPGLKINFAQDYWRNIANSPDKVRADLRNVAAPAGFTLSEDEINSLFNTPGMQDYFRLRNKWFARDNLNNYLVTTDRNKGLEDSPEYKLVVAHLVMHPEDFGAIVNIKKNIADLKKLIENQEKDIETLKKMEQVQTDFAGDKKVLDGMPTSSTDEKIQTKRAEYEGKVEEHKSKWFALKEQLVDPPTVSVLSIDTPNSASESISTIEFGKDTAAKYSRKNPAVGSFLHNKAELTKIEGVSDTGGDTLKKGDKITAREMLFRLYRINLQKSNHYLGEKALDKAGMMQVGLDLIDVEDDSFKHLNDQLSQLFVSDRDGIFWRKMLNRVDRGWRDNNFISADFFSACGWGMAKLFMETGASFKDAKDKFFQQDVSAWIDNVKKVVVSTPSGASIESAPAGDTGKKSALEAKITDITGQLSTKEAELKDANTKLAAETDADKQKPLHDAVESITKEMETLKTELASAQAELASAGASSSPVTEKSTTIASADLFEINKNSTIEDIRLAVSRGKLDQEKLFRLATILSMVLSGYQVYKKKFKLEDRSVRDIAALESLIRNLKIVRAEMIADRFSTEMEPYSNEERAQKLTELFNSQIAEDDRLNAVKMNELDPESAEWKKSVLEHGANKALTVGWTKNKGKQFLHWANTPNRKMYEYYKQNGFWKTAGKGIKGALFLPKTLLYDAPKAALSGISKGAKAVKDTTVNVTKKPLSIAGKVAKTAFFLTPIGLPFWLGWKLAGLTADNTTK